MRSGSVFRFVHREVGVTHHFLGRLVCGIAERDADAGTGADFGARDPEGRAQRILQAFGQDDGIVRAAAAQLAQDREFVAAQAGYHVGGARDLLDAARRAHEELVAGAVAHAVVDALEPVEIQVHDRELV